MLMKGLMYVDEQNYIKERLDNQIQWYSNKSKTSQKWYKWMKFFTCLLALSLSPLALIDILDKNLIIAIIGATISLLSFSQSLWKHHENWILYRTTCELLKHEKFLYLTHSGEYGYEKIPLNILVERCESIISSENLDWSQLHKSEPLADKPNHSSKGS